MLPFRRDRLRARTPLVSPCTANTMGGVPPLPIQGTMSMLNELLTEP